MTEIHERLDELKELGLYRRMRMVSGPQGPRVVLDGKPVLLLCSNNYLGLADHPRVREAAADAAMRWGVGAGASRLVSGTMTIHRRLEERLAEFKRTRGGAAVRLGLPGQHRRRHRAGRPRRGRLLRRAQPRLDHRRLPAGARRDVRLPPRRRRAPRVGPARRPTGAASLIVTDSRLLDGRRRRAAGRDRRARPPPRRARGGRRGARHRLPGTRRARRGGRGRRSRARSTSSSARSARRSAPTARSSPATQDDGAATWSTPRGSFIFSTAPPPPAVAGGAGRARAARRAAAQRVEQAAGQRATRCATSWRARASRSPARRPRSCRSSSATPTQAMRICEAAIERGVFAQAIRPPTVPEGTSRLRLARDGLAHARPSCARPRSVLGRAALQAGLPPGRRRARGGRARRRRGDVRRARSTSSASRVAPPLALARPLRHRHRHRASARPSSPRRCAAALRAARRARGGVQAGRHRASTSRRARTGPPTTSCWPPRRASRPRRGHAASLRAGRSRRTSPRELAGTAARARRARGRARARAARRRRWSPRASAGCSCRSRSATRSATSRVDLGLPVVVAAPPGPGDDQPHAAHASRRRARPASTCARSC